MIIMAETAAQAGGDREKLRAGLRAGIWNGIMGEVQFLGDKTRYGILRTLRMF
jgi:hypothetical protein